MIDKKNDEKEAHEFKKIYNHHPDKRREFMTSTQFEVEDFFVDIISKDRISQDQIFKLIKFLTKMV